MWHTYTSWSRVFPIFPIVICTRNVQHFWTITWDKNNCLKFGKIRVTKWNYTVIDLITFHNNRTVHTDKHLFQNGGHRLDHHGISIIIQSMLRYNQFGNAYSGLKYNALSFVFVFLLSIIMVSKRHYDKGRVLTVNFPAIFFFHIYIVFSLIFNND